MAVTGARSVSIVCHFSSVTSHGRGRVLLLCCATRTITELRVLDTVCSWEPVSRDYTQWYRLSCPMHAARPATLLLCRPAHSAKQVCFTSALTLTTTRSPLPYNLQIHLFHGPSESPGEPYARLGGEVQHRAVWARTRQGGSTRF